MTDGDGRAPSPVIVLVRPQLARNIGKAARAMLNFGLTDLRLVDPRDGWPNPDAGPASSGADSVLRDAVAFATLSDAVADCSQLFATTVRRRGVTKPVVDPVEAARRCHAHAGRTAYIFGPERSGLETDDVAVADTIVTVPINPEFGSLNLAQAVILCAYDWSRHVTLAQPPAVPLEPPARAGAIDGLYGQLDDALARRNYFYPEIRAVQTRRTLRTMLGRTQWTDRDVQMMRGIIGLLDKRDENGARRMPPCDDQSAASGEG